MKRPNGVGDLQKGERYVWFSVQPAVHSSQSLRYVNMDYLFISTLRHSADIVELVVSYDIVCQWSRNVWERMAIYSHSIRVDHTGQKNYHFLIPKFHLPAHIKACQTVFSFNFNRHVGRTDGEAPERGWSHINPKGAPGCRPVTRGRGRGGVQQSLKKFTIHASKIYPWGPVATPNASAAPLIELDG